MADAYQTDRLRRFLLYVSIVGFFYLASCQARPAQPSVVIYTSVDQVYSEPVLKDFEAASGIKVLAVYDVEAAKTTGLANRLAAEKDHPLADVFWNGEFAQTLQLKEEGILQAYFSPARQGIPAQYLDPDGFWAGTGGRARVFLINTRRLSPERYPTALDDLLNPDLPGNQIGMANPLFGTTATQAAALYAVFGPEKARQFYQALKERGVSMLDGNSVVRDLVVCGQLSVGLTDTDDACGAIEKGASVAMVVPDQGEGGMGTLVVPNTVAMIAQAPHPQEARQLIDYLLSRETETRLVKAGWFQISLRSPEVQPDCLGESTIKPMRVTFEDLFVQMATSQKDLEEIFIR